MSQTIPGIYRNGRVELSETSDVKLKEGPVLVTFCDSPEIDLKSRGITREQAADLRARLACFVEDWDSPEMRAYDDYDGAKSRL